MFFIYVALPVYIATIIAAFNMDSLLKGFLFLITVLFASGLLYTFITFPLASAIGVIAILFFFLLKLKR